VQSSAAVTHSSTMLPLRASVLRSQRRVLERHIQTIPDVLKQDPVSRVRSPARFKPATAKDVAVHPGDDPASHKLPSHVREEDTHTRRLRPQPYKGHDGDDLDPHLDGELSPRMYDRMKDVADTRRRERELHLPQGYKSWQEVARAESKRFNKVKRAHEEQLKQAVLSKPIRIPFAKPSSRANKSGSTIVSLRSKRADEEASRSDPSRNLALVEAPRAVTELQQRKSTRLARVSAQIHRALMQALSQKLVREPGLYPFGMPVNIVEVEVTADLRVARVRWQLPLRSITPQDAQAAVAREWSDRAAKALAFRDTPPSMHPAKARRLKEKRIQGKEARELVRMQNHKVLASMGIPVAVDDSDLEELDSTIRRASLAATPETSFGVDGESPSSLLHQPLGGASPVTPPSAPSPRTVSEGLMQSVTRSQLAEWRTHVRSTTKKPTLARVMRWAESSLEPEDEIGRTKFKEVKLALEMAAGELRRHVGSQVPLRVLPRLEFHPWIGEDPVELVKRARRGFSEASMRV
jgi:ribosome-binding factor A